MENAMNDHPTRDVIRMLLEKIGSKFVLEQFNKCSEDLDLYIKYLKIRANKYECLRDEINFWL